MLLLTEGEVLTETNSTTIKIHVSTYEAIKKCKFYCLTLLSLSGSNCLIGDMVFIENGFSGIVNPDEF